MKKVFLYINILLLFSINSCSISKEVTGVYYKKGVDFDYILTLNKDSTFKLSHSYFEAKSECKGKWNFISKKEISLKCGAGSLIDQISSGDLSNREFKVAIVSGDKLEIQNVILLRNNKLTQ